MWSCAAAGGKQNKRGEGECKRMADKATTRISRRRAGPFCLRASK